MKKFQPIVVVAFAALVIPAVVCAVFFGNGAVTVAAPPGRPLKISAHTLDVTSGTFDRFYPLSDQSFVLFDVTNFISSRTTPR